MSVPILDREPADQLVGITGLNSSGTPTNYVNADVNGNAYVRDSINTSLINGAISVGIAQVEAKVSTSRLVGRKVIQVTPTNGTIYFGGNGVTVSTGTPIFKNQSYPIAASDAVPVYLIAAATTDVRIVEGS